MHRNITARRCWTGVASFILVPSLLFAQSSAPTITAGKLADNGDAPVIDGRVNEEVWRSVEPYSTFTQQDPNEGAPASEKTEVRVIVGKGNVYVGIIDEGYMYTHEDLAANAATNPGEIAGDGVDNDGNGYVDDVYGWDFDGNNNSVFDGAGDDHGTHVAGTIGAVGGNGKGVAGVCWSVKLMNAKFLGRRGGSTANAIKAVDYFTDMKTRHNLNLIATSNSWGGGGYSQALEDAIERANNAGILFIAAAGMAAHPEWC